MFLRFYADWNSSRADFAVQRSWKTPSSRLYKRSLRRRSICSLDLYFYSSVVTHFTQSELYLRLSRALSEPSLQLSLSAEHRDTQKTPRRAGGQICATFNQCGQFLREEDAFFFSSFIWTPASSSCCGRHFPPANIHSEMREYAEKRDASAGC